MRTFLLTFNPERFEIAPPQLSTPGADSSHRRNTGDVMVGDATD